MHESLIFQRLSTELSEFGAIDSTAFNSWKSVVTAQEKQASQTLDVTQHGNTTPHSNNGGYHSNNHYNNVTPHSNSAGYHTNNLQTNYTPHVDNAGYHTNNRSYTYYPHYDSSAYHYNNRSYTYTPHYDNSAYHYNNRSYTYTPHTDNAGYHSNTRKYTYTAHGNSRYHSNSGHSNTGSHSNYWYNHTNTTPHNNRARFHTNYTYGPVYGRENHNNSLIPHNNTRDHHDAMYSHKNTPGTHTNNRVNNATGNHSNTAGSHSNSGTTTYTPHSNYAASHSNSGHGNYVPHSNGGDYHSNSGHGNYVPHSNGGDYHSNSGHGNYSPHSNTGASHSNTGYTQAIPHTNTASVHNNNGLHTNYVPHSNTRPHNNSAFDHQNYIPSKTHFFNVENDTLVKGTVSIGLFAFDKNNDGSGTQDTLSKTVKYTLSIRKVKNLDGSASASSWRTLLNATTQDVYDLNTIDPLGTGNSDPKATEGYYEIKAVAKNDSKTEGGVTKNYVGQEQVITVKVQQNTNPDISVNNGSEFIGFTFSEHGAMTSTGSYKSYSDKLYATAPVDKQAGLFITVNMTDPDNGNYQKAKVYLQKPDGTTVANSTVDVIWSNGSSVAQSNGSVVTGYAFIPYSVYTALGNVDGVKVVVDLKDYYNSACTEEAGGHINRSTLSKSDSTIMLLNTDVTKPTVTDSGNPTSWVKSANISVSATDNKTGINRIQKPDGSWVSGSSASHLVTANGNYNFVVEDKAGNQTIKTISVTRVDSGAPSITLTPSTTASTNQDVVITANVSDSVSGIAVQKWASGNQNASYFASAGTTFSGSFIATDNGTYTVYAKDNAGNEMVRTITVSNIDKIAPTAPTLVPSTTVPTNQNVSVIITYPADATVKQYKIGSTGTWTNYSSAVVLSGNNTVYARGQDNAGNWSDESSLVVNNIDKTAPDAPSLSPSTTAPTNQNVSVTITYPSDANVKQYKIGSAGTWTTYSSAVVLSDNNTVYARCQDVAGNWSSESSLAVGNIDKIAPNAPTLSASTTAPTNKDVSVTIGYPTDAVVKEYKVGSTGTWIAYSTPVVLSGNNTVYARAKDNAGNWSTESSLAVANIDKVAPIITVAPYNTNPTNQDITVTVSTNEGSLNATSHKFTENGSFKFIATDPAGNVTEKIVTITNIDKIAPNAPTFSADRTSPTNMNVSITINYPSDADTREYRIGSTGTWTVYSTPVVLSGNNTVYARAKDNAGNYSAISSYEVSNIDKVAPSLSLSASTTAPTNQDVTITATFSDSASGVQSVKYATGEQSEEYFRTGGFVLSGTTITATTNGTWTVYVKDKAGNEVVRSITISNIDKIAPSKPTLSADKTAPTNTNVTVTISYPTDANVKQYKVGVNGTWKSYTAPIVLSDNDTVYAQAQDIAGNWSGESSLKVSNIDKIAPVITIAPYNTNPTNQDITVTASTNEGTLNATSHKFTQNGSFEFVATDPAGNVTKKTVVISNIDKIAPVTPTFKANTTAPTNENVYVTITYPSDAVVKEYKVGSGEWVAYETPIMFAQNGSVEARCQDNAGNWSEVSKYNVTNIDKVAPIITVQPYNTNPTNQDITVSVTVNEGTLNYTSHTFTENGSFTFEAVDPAGNKSTKTITISNIDKIAPSMPTMKADKVVPVNTNVIVTITYPADAHIKQYKIGESGTWANYTTPVVFGQNGTVYARTQDIAGNWSEVAVYEVSNIDKVAPVITVAPYSTNPTNQDITVTASTNEGTLNAISHTFIENGSFEFVATDIAGNVSKRIVTISNIDKIAPNTPVISADKTQPTNQNVTVSISYPSDAHVKQFKIGSGEWRTYTTTFALSDNNTVYARTQDIAGNWSEVAEYKVSNIDKVAPIITIAPYNTSPTNQNITVFASVNEGTLNAESYTFSQNGSYTFEAIDPAGNKSTKTVTISNIDKVAPVTPTLKANITVPTNTDVSVSISYPNDANVKQYKIGNGEWREYTKALVFSENETVYARCQDVAGNWSIEGRYDVNNIDKIAPNAPGFTPSETAPTNKDVSVTINFPADGHVKQYRLETGTWVNYTTPVVFSQDGVVYSRTQDIAGNWSEVSSYTVNNIDKVAPTSPRVQVLSYNTLVIDKSTDAKSGLAKYMYQLNGGEWLEYAGAVELPDGQYRIVAKAVDKAGNEASTSIDYLVFKSALDKALDAVVKAENSQLQADVDTARPLVSALPNGGEKAGLQNRLAYVQGCIDKEFMRQELTQIQEDIAEDKIVEIPQVRTINAKVSGITMRAMALPSSVYRADLDTHIDKVEHETEATEKVIIAETSLSQADIDSAKVLVSKVTTLSVKTALNDRLDAVQRIVNGINAVNKAKETSNQDDVDRAWDVVHNMPDSELKDNLQKELAKIDNKLRVAKEAVVKAEKYPNMRSYIIDADNKVKVVKNTVPEKPGLAKRVQDLKDAFNANIENAEYQENLRQATHYTEQAETYVTKYYIDKAQVYINALPEGDANRISLQARLDVAQGKYENVVNPPKQNTSAEIKEATKWVDYSEKYRTAVYMNKAQNLVNALSDSPEKDELQARLNAIVPK